MIARTPARPTYLVRLRPEPGVDAVHALRAALKYLLRRCGMRAISVEEEKANQLANRGRHGAASADQLAPTIGE
jgi:hypothetical protein